MGDRLDRITEILGLLRLDEFHALIIWISVFADRPDRLKYPLTP